MTQILGLGRTEHPARGSAAHFLNLCGTVRIQPEKGTSVPTILLVDDEPIILAMITLALEPEGFKVLTAVNGADAISIFRSHRGEIGLLVTDMMMPEMDGPTLAARVLAEDPGMPVLFMSGYYEAIECGGSGQFEFLAKPFPLNALVAEVRSLTRTRAASEGS